ncbi:MAG: efflux RND transporter permease subunit [Candidatus Paceibacterota bacterium]
MSTSNYDKKQKYTSDVSNDAAKTTDSRYLERLSFNPELRKSFLNFFVSNFRVVMLLIALISIAGIYAYSALPRESNPEVKIPIAVITDTYPGASPKDIEELVTKKIETGISGVGGIKTITSSSANSFSAVTVEFEANQDLNDSIRKLRDAVTSLKGKLPADATDPVVNEISFDNTPILSAILTGPYDGTLMRKYAEDTQDELDKISGIRQVNVSGGDQNEFEISYDPAKLLFYGISLDQANGAIKASNVAVPVGNFEGKEFNYSIRSDSRFFDATALGNIPVSYSQGGGIVFVKDLADVKETAIKKTVYSRLSISGSNPENAVTLDIVKRTGGNIIDISNEAKATVERMVKTFPPGIKFAYTQDMSKQIDTQFTQLTHDFILTLLLVFGILFLIVGLKEAFVAGLAIPLVFFITFAVMYGTGISLNFLSVFSLILSLGLLVDDAIVVVSATKQYMRTGKYTPEEAVLLVLNDFKVVLTTTTLTTVWAFVPLLLATGIIGQFIKSIPITVSVTLISSLFVALMINHPLAAVLERIRLSRNLLYISETILFILAGLFLFNGGIWGYTIGLLILIALGFIIRWYEKGGKEKLVANEILVEQEWESDDLIKKKLREQGNREESTFGGRLIHGIIHFDKLLPIYEKYLRKFIETKKGRTKILSYVSVAFIIAILLPITGVVQSEFFPSADSDYIYINIEAPTGLIIENTDQIIRQVETRLLKFPEISNFSTVVGNQAASPSSAGAGLSPSSSNLASIVVTLVDSDKRSEKSYDIGDKIRNDIQNVKGATIDVESPRGGPPSGSAFEAHISGDDLAVLAKIANDLEPKLSSIDGVINTDISLKDTAPEYTFNLDPIKMAERGISSAYIGSVLRTAVSGTKITTVIKDNKEIDVIAQFEDSKIPSLDAIQNLQVVGPGGQLIFIKDVADVELRPSVNSITRIDQKRTVLLTAGIDARTSSNAVLASFEKKLAKEYKMPDGYAITYGGENEQNAESVLSILRAMIIAALLIVSTLIIQFNSFKKALIVLVTLPLALIGVFVGMAILRVNLSFPGLIGILALFGIVVKNAIILIDKINLNMKTGIPFMDSVVDAGKSRLEAIFITSIATICGIIPITLSNETWTALGSAVIFGLSVSSFLTLFVIPVMFVSIIGEKERF